MISGKPNIIFSWCSFNAEHDCAPRPCSDINIGHSVIITYREMIMTKQIKLLIVAIDTVYLLIKQ